MMTKERIELSLDSEIVKQLRVESIRKYGKLRNVSQLITDLVMKTRDRRPLVQAEPTLAELEQLSADPSLTGGQKVNRLEVLLRNNSSMKTVLDKLIKKAEKQKDAEKAEKKAPKKREKKGEAQVCGLASNNAFENSVRYFGTRSEWSKNHSLLYLKTMKEDEIDSKELVHLRPARNSDSRLVYRRDRKRTRWD